MARKRPAWRYRVPPTKYKSKSQYWSLKGLGDGRSVHVLSREINVWLSDDRGRTIAELARRAQLHPTTVSKLLYRDTLHPRWWTVVSVLDAVGFVAMRLDRAS